MDDDFAKRALVPGSASRAVRVTMTRRLVDVDEELLARALVIIVEDMLAGRREDDGSELGE